MVAGSDGPASTIVRGGAGDFRSLTPTGLYSAALAAPGLSNAEAQLICIGSAVPTPDWSAYLPDPSSIPSQCTVSVDAVTLTPLPPVRAGARDRLGPPIRYEAADARRRRLHGTRDELPAVVHVQPGARSVLVLRGRVVTRVRRRQHGG